MQNKDLRTRAKEKGVHFWQIAEKLNISEPTMTRKLRHELSGADKSAIFEIIDEIAAAKQGEEAST